ncbi:MAG TPA: hypothetical protein EYG19_04320 [Verrucomicrobia bacterium]|nr:hypothetical protein [Verrucomicrobiota bacterium]
MSRFWQIFCATHLLAFSLLAGELTFRNVHVRTRTLADAERFHGYAAHQFELENLSTISRTVTIQLPQENYGNRANIEDLRRTVTLGPKSRKVVSLYQPPLPIDYYDPTARFTVDGETRVLNDAFSAHVDSSDSFGNYHQVVVLASRSWSSSKLLMPAPSSGGTPLFRVDVAKGLISQWPHHWLAFSGFDGMLLRAKEWNAAPAEVRQAITQYVRAGGRLFVVGTIPLPTDARMLSADQMEKRRASAESFSESIDSFSSAHSKTGFYPEEMGEEETVHENHAVPTQGAASSTVFALGWGLIRIVDASADKDEIDQGIKQVLEAHYAGEYNLIPALVSVLAGAQNLGSFDDFFSIVDDASVPVRLMIVILIGFVVIAGPVNLVLLHKLKRRTWFLWTLPAVSILTSAIVFGTALLNEGFTPTVRRDVITILNQESQQASTIGALGIYAPVSPGNLEFSAHTEVTPLLSSHGQDSGSNRGVDWSKGQSFTGKWVASRVPAHFALRKSEPRKERLSVTWKGGTPTVVNSLSANINQLWLANARGNIFESTNLRAGQRAELQRVAGMQTVIDYVNTDFLLSTHKDTPESDYPKNLAPGTYLAQMDGSPFMENPIGRGQLKTHALVFGVLTKAEASP